MQITSKKNPARKNMKVMKNLDEKSVVDLHTEFHFIYLFFN